MASTTHQSEHHEPVFREIDSSAERILGADARLLYGVLAPALLVIGLIVVLAVNLATWLLVTIVVMEIVLMALVVTGVLSMMSGDGDDPVP